jgi:hypothetical protein
VARFSRLLTVLVLLGLSTTPLSFSWPDQASSSDPPPSRETAFRQIDDDRHVIGEIVEVERSGHVGIDRNQCAHERIRDYIHNCGAAEWRHPDQ